MSDKNLNIKVTADSKPAQSGLQKITESVNKLGKNQTIRSVNTLGGALKGVAGTFGLVVSAAKVAVSKVKEYAETAQVQIKAERQLESAAKNNPYLSKSNVAQLKEYASELQSISTVGDEELLPLMAQLAAAGRNQNEIQNIMSAALDVSASGAMSLESAVRNLNKTYSGLSGELGETIPELKTLTTEQLKNGDAVQLVKDKYKGMSEESANATGGIQQMKNSLGDFKEIMGAPFAEAANSFGRSVSQAIDKINTKLSKSKKAFQEYLDYLNSTENAGDSQTLNDSKKNLADLEEKLKQFNDIKDYLESGGTLEDIPTELKDNVENAKNIADQQIYELEEKLSELRREENKYIAGQKSNENGELESVQTEISSISSQIKELKNSTTTDFLDNEIEKLESAISLEKERLNVLQKEKDLQDAKNESEKANAAAELAKANYELAIKNYDDKIAKQKELGKALSDEEVLRGRISVMEEGLLSMVSDEKNHISWSNYQVQNEFIPAIQKAYEELYKLQEEANKSIANVTDQTASKIENETQTLTEKIKAFFKDIGTSLKDSLFDGTLSEYLSSIGDTMSDVSSLVEENSSALLESQTSQLDSLYESGAISYAEYAEQIEDIQKDAAEANYNAAMAEWSISLAQAIANVAQGVTEAYATGPAGYIKGTLLAIAGAAQIATITANKPQKPSFSSGGIVPGSSYSGDNVQANVNSGEMVLTTKQQKALWNIANGNGTGGLKQQVYVQNYASDKVSSDVSFSGENLIVTVREIVNSEMQKGSFRDSMKISNARNNGVKVL